MIKQECIGIPDMILLLMIFCFKKIKIKAEIVLSPGGAYFKVMKPSYTRYTSRVASNHSILAALAEWTIKSTIYVHEADRFLSWRIISNLASAPWQFSRLKFSLIKFESTLAVH